jgi:serine/threonine protein kinase
MKLYVERDYGIETNMKTLQYLQQSWSDIAQDAWPPAVDINELRIVKQLNEAVMLVDFSGQSRAIFKCASDSLHHMYHELRFLLTCPRHPHIMPRPLAVVLKKSAFGGRSGVVGFLLQYFEGGSLRDILPARQRSATLSDTVKLRWCRQVASALTHLHEMGTFYSDLRPDNVLLDAEENAVLCDFEQRGNWYEWSPPEVLYRQYVENIRARLPDRVVISPYDRLLKEYARSHSLSTSACYTPAESPIEARNRAWFALPPSAREKATVYNFGLFIYCVFEGLSNVQRNVANQFPIEPEVEYPTFRRTPEALRKIIQQCIGNPPDWGTSELQSGSSRVVRVNGLLYPETRTDLEPDTHQTFDAVMDSLLGFWSTELMRAERFLESADWSAGDFGRDRASLRDVVDALESQSEDLY